MCRLQIRESVSYIDIHLEIHNGGRIKTKLYDKRDYFTFPIVNLRYVSSNIPASPAYGVFISQLIHYSRVCTQYNAFLDRDQLLTQKLLNHDAPRLNSLQKLYGRHHNLVDRYEISISQMTMNLLLFTQMFSYLYHCQDSYRNYCIYA